MKVLFLCDWFLPHAGGARVYYYNLYQNFAKQFGHSVTILTKKVPGWEAFDEEQSGGGFRILRFGKPLDNWKYHQLPRILGPLMRSCLLLAQERFDMIHFGDLYPQGVLSLGLKQVLGQRYLAYCHGEEITQTDRRRYQPKVRNMIYREADTVVAANEYARQNLIRIGIPEGRIRKITPGVDGNRFQPRRPPEALIRQYSLDGKTVLLTVGRLVPRKGHAAALGAIRELLPEFPHLAYLIVGTGPEEQALRHQAIEQGISRVVHFAGSVSDAALPEYYNACDLYMMPTFDERVSGDAEGFGMVFLEANACAKAVLAGRSGGTSEAVIHGHTGLLVNPQDPRELVTALRGLLQNHTLRTTLGQNGRQRVEAEFSWAARARDLDRTTRETIGAC
jgi:phosphatidyl-myo-inositol dimannoside synthase